MVRYMLRTHTLSSASTRSDSSCRGPSLAQAAKVARSLMRLSDIDSSSAGMSVGAAPRRRSNWMAWVV
jgi:hypothetical protein